MTCSSGIKISAVYSCDASGLELGVQPGDNEILNVVYWGFVNVVLMTPGLNLSTETARVTSIGVVCVGNRPLGTDDGDDSVCCTERKARKHSEVGSVTLAGEGNWIQALVHDARESSH